MSSASAEPLAPVWVAAVALLEGRSGGDAPVRVLMQERLPGGAHGGLWEFPGGKLEPGETPEHAAVRELAEELDITIAPADLAPIAFASGETAGGEAPRPLVILLFACCRWSGAPVSHAASRLGWYALGDLPDLSMPPLDYPLADALLKILTHDAN